jgi:putative transposase
MLSRGHKEEITRTLDTKAVEVFSLWIAGSRAVWNASVAANQQHYQTWKEAGSDKKAHPVEDKKYAWIYEQKSLNGEDYHWLKQVPSVLLRNARDLWCSSFEAFLKGRRRVPKFRSCKDKSSAWITREMLSIDRRVVGDEHAMVVRVFAGKGKGRHVVFAKTLPWSQTHALPASIRISKRGGRFWMSFSYDCEPDQAIVTQEQLAQEYAKSTESELREITLGLDRGVRKPIATSRGDFMGHPDDEANRIAKKQARKKRLQRRLSRMKKGGQNRRKVREKLAKQHAKLRNVRHNRAHHISKELVNHPQTQILVFEHLRKGMTRSAKGTKAKPGKNVKAKAGLNRRILDSMWGQIKTFSQYKAAECNKLVVFVPAYNTSRECSVCHDIHEDNRKGEVFCCRKCAHTQDADTNAGINIRNHGIKKILDGSLIQEIRASENQRKRITARKSAETTARTAESHACEDPVRPSGSQKARIVEAGKEAHLQCA